MAKSEKYTCDGCGKVKGEVNCWWLVGDSEEWKLMPWNEEQAWRYSHFCGQECAIKDLSSWMQDRADEIAQKGKG